jgi:hypothetical protein
MAHASPAATNRFLGGVRTGLKTAGRAISTRQQRGKTKAFTRWSKFCYEMEVSDTLDTVVDHSTKYLFLIVYGVEYRAAGARGKPVRAATVLEQITAACDEIVLLGGSDPRRPEHSPDKPPPAEYAVWTEYKDGLRKEDGPPSRAHPANITILKALVDTLDLAKQDDPTMAERWSHLLDLAIVAFFWLLRPCEYLFRRRINEDDGNTTPYELRHIHLTIDGKTYTALTAPLHDSTSIARIQSATLLLDDQKNGAKGDSIGHAATSDPILCPAKALGRIAQRHQRYAAANPHDPILPQNRKIYEHQGPDGTWHATANAHVTFALRTAAKSVVGKTGISPKLISARSLRPGGATALLCAGIDKDTIKLVGRWKSDAMLLYLRAQAVVIGQRFSQQMLDNGSYAFSPLVLQDDPFALPLNLPQDVQDLHALIAPRQ